MKHAVILSSQNGISARTAEAELSEGRTVTLAEAEYTTAELEVFEKHRSEWIFRRSGEHMFLADSDSGEDARGYYCGYFDPIPERAVFDNGVLVGFYLCARSISYSGISRSSYSMDSWGYPGDDPFRFISWGNKTHLFLFADSESITDRDWTLLRRDPQKEYRSYIDF